MTNFKEEIERGLGSFSEEARRVKQRVMQKEMVSRKRQWGPVFISIAALVLFIGLMGIGRENKQANEFSFDKEQFEILVVLNYYSSPLLTTKEIARYNAFNLLMREKAQIYVASQKVTMPKQEIKKLQKELIVKFEADLARNSMLDGQERIEQVIGKSRRGLIEFLAEGEAYRRAYNQEFNQELNPFEALKIYEKDFSHEIDSLKDELKIDQPRKLGNPLDLALSFTASDALAVTKQEGEMVYTDPLNAGDDLLVTFQFDLAGLQEEYHLPNLELSSYQDYIEAAAEAIANGRTDLQGLWEALVIYWNTFKKDYADININTLRVVTSDKSFIERNGSQTVRGEIVIQGPAPLEDASLTIKYLNNPATPIIVEAFEQLPSEGLYKYRIAFEAEPHSSNEEMLQQVLEGEYTISIEGFTLHFK